MPLAYTLILAPQIIGAGSLFFRVIINFERTPPPAW